MPFYISNIYKVQKQLFCHFQNRNVRIDKTAVFC